MGNTNPGGVANTLDAIKTQITEILDEIYATETKTAAFKGNPYLIRGFNRAKTGQLATIIHQQISENSL